MCLSFDLNEEASIYDDGYIAKVGELSIEDDVTSLCFFLFLFKRVATVGLSESVWNFYFFNKWNACEFRWSLNR